MTARFPYPAIVGLLIFTLSAWLSPALAAQPPAVPHRASSSPPTWTEVRQLPMRGDLKAFWNVGGGDVGYNNREAVAHGFRLVNLLGTFSDYPGNQKENIDKAWKDNRTNPWQPDNAQSRVSVRCGTRTVELPLLGRHTGIFLVRRDRVTRQ